MNAAAIVEIISQTLAQVDPENGPYYQENAAAYTEQLRALDGRFRQIVDIRISIESGGCSWWRTSSPCGTLQTPTV